MRVCRIDLEGLRKVSGDGGSAKPYLPPLPDPVNNPGIPYYTILGTFDKSKEGYCGNGTCEDGEDANTCPQDCGGGTYQESRISAGYAHTCALTSSGGVKC